MVILDAFYVVRSGTFISRYVAVLLDLNFKQDVCISHAFHRDCNDVSKIPYFEKDLV